MPGMHHPLRNPLMVEVGDLLPGVEVLQQGRSALAGGERVIGVVDPHPWLVVKREPVGSTRTLSSWSCLPSPDGLIAKADTPLVDL